MPLRNVATTYTIEQQRLEINLLAGDVNNIATGSTSTTASSLAAGATGADLTLSGNLTVNGTQTILNTATLEVEDKNIVIAKGSTTDAAANTGGITLKGANDKTITYSSTGDKWVSNIAFEIENHLEVAGTCEATLFDGAGDNLTNLPAAQLTGALPAIDGSALTGIAAGATIADAGNANANSTVLFSTNSSGSNQTLSTDGGLLYNAAEDALKVNGTIITAGGITGAGGSCVVAAANHSSTCSITVSDDVQVAGKFLQGATSTNSNTIFHVEGTIANGAEFIGNNTQQGFYLALQNKNTNNDAWTTIQSWDAGGQGVSSIRFIQVNNDNNQGAIAFRTRDTSGGEQERLRITPDGTVTATGAIEDEKGHLRRIPLQDESGGAYVLVASDAGQCVHAHGSTTQITVNQNVFSAGDAVSIVNGDASDLTITQGSSFNLRNTGDGSTGDRTLSQFGMATIYFSGHNVGYISGAGLS